MTFSESLNYLHKIKKEDIKLFVIFSVVFLFIYGSMFMKIGYHPDELDTINSTSLALYRGTGRWFHALWRWATGMNPHAWAQGCTSCLFLSLSLVILTKALHLKDFVTKVVFGLVYLALSQFAYVMDYIFQADSVAFGLVCIALSSCTIQQKGYASTFWSLLLLTIALGIYQSLIINFFIVVLVLVYRGVSESTWKSMMPLIVRGITCSVLALVVYYFICKISVLLIHTPSEVIETANKYQGEFNIVSKIGYSNINGLMGQFLYTLKELGCTLVCPGLYDGEWMYTTAWIPLVCLFVCIFKSDGHLLNKAGRVCLLVCIWVMPFLLCLVFLNPDAQGDHNRLGEPLALASLWVLALPSIRWKHVTGTGFAILLAFCIIKSSNYVNDFVNARRYAFEAQYTAYRQMEFEAVAKASESNIPIIPQNILLFRFTDKGEYKDYDPLRHYPALSYINPRAKDQSLAEHEEALKHMPCWPRNGSMVAHKGKIIIKCDDTSFVDSR